MGRPTKSNPARPRWAVRLEAARLLTELEQVDFAREIGVEAETYRTYERGRSQPKFATLERICERTGVSLDWLIRGKGMTLAASAQERR